MSGGLKLPLAASLNRVAQQRVGAAIQLLGKALPCSVVAVDGNMVTVQFDVRSDFTLPQVTVPVATSQYDRLPIQPGELGVVLPADAYIGGVSGLGGGVADLTSPANLSALVYQPISNTAWPSVDPNARVIYGPNGVVLMDEGRRCIITLTPTGIAITLPDGGSVVVTGGDVVADGISLKTHVHPGVQSGGSDTGEPL